MSLTDDLERTAAAATALAPDGASLTAVLAAEPATGVRDYLCAFENANGDRTWVVVDDRGEPVADRPELRDVVSIAALCEIAEESAFGSDLESCLPSSWPCG